MPLVGYRSLGSLLADGWSLLFSDMWTILRLSWLPLLAAAVLGGVASLVIVALRGTPWAAVVFALLLLSAVVISAAWAVLLISHRHIDGTFAAPSVRSLLATRRAAMRAGLSQLRAVLTHAGSWGVLCGLLLAGVLTAAALSIVGGLPYMVVAYAQSAAAEAAAAGDKVDAPSWLPLAGVVLAAAWCAVCVVASWLVLFPLSLYCGRLRHEERLTNS